MGQRYPEISGKLARLIQRQKVFSVATAAGERAQLNRWAERKGEAGIRQYWQHKNRISLDGRPTHSLDSDPDPA